jgi:hypothetical protein
MGAREKPDKSDVAVVQVDERAVEAVRETAAAGAGAVLVVGPEHDVVGEKLRASVEQLDEGLPAVLGVELVGLLDRYPRELEPLLPDLFVLPRLLGLELSELVTGRLPVLAGSNLVLRHLTSSSPPASTTPGYSRRVARRPLPGSCSRLNGAAHPAATAPLRGRQRDDGSHHRLALRAVHFGDHAVSYAS